MHPLWSNFFRQRRQEKTLSERLREIPVFSELRKGELRKLEKIVHLRRYRPSEEVFREGEPGVGMYIIRFGGVDILQRSEDGSEQLLTHLEAGDFFGELALLDEAPRSATARATEPTELWGVFRPDLMDLIQRDPRLGLKIVLPLARLVGERLRRTNELLKRVSEVER
ncbi:MAG TPA: cyclic nucleotide-binding domain-containing protein [Candidatus Latescibacteria bacterium]|nr:cyclic nucleotide-binding domain-containing protein [Candidatus Latescibacterota bacterium]